MDLRSEVLEHQLKLKTFSYWINDVLDLQNWKATEGLSLGERFAKLGALRLSKIKFIHTEEEPIIGRVIPWELDPEEQQKAAEELQKIRRLRFLGQTGHAEPFYDEVFAVGIEGLIRKTEDLPSFRIAAEGLSAMIRNAAEQTVRDDVRESCLHISRKPPRNFQDAIQLLWFIDLAIQAGDLAALVGPGRLDRRLIRFYEADLAAGTLTRDEALKMIESLYLFINQFAQRGLAYAVMVGGSGIYNDLSYLSLEALRRTRLTYPSVGLCWEPATPPDLRELAVELIAEGISNVAVFNDALIQKSMIHYGVPEKDAGEYINSTCVEITPCGASNVYVASPYFPLCILLLEYMEQTSAQDYETFRKEYFDYLGEKIKVAVAEENEFRRIRAEELRRPLQSLFTLDCISSGKDIEEGGARYNWIECSFVGLANLADSLYVIRKEVFESKSVSMTELCSLLKSNFKNAEHLRLKYLNLYPKYGNNQKEVDQEIPVLMDFIKQRCAAEKIYPGNTHFIPGTFCWISHERYGAICGATPDGRLEGFPFADGAGPAQGRELNGPTDAVKSVCSWDHSCLLGGTAFNQRYSSSAVSTKEARKNLEQLIDVFIRSGGFETQINILDAETLKDAKEHPENYRDLVVRIGGYTDYFTGLSEGMQDEIIMRTIYQKI